MCDESGNMVSGCNSRFFQTVSVFQLKLKSMAAKTSPLSPGSHVGVMAWQTVGTQIQRPETELRGEKEFIVYFSQRGRKAVVRLRIARIQQTDCPGFGWSGRRVDGSGEQAGSQAGR